MSQPRRLTNAPPVRTHCRCCSAVCGILVETEGDRVVRVSGDPDDPRSQGYICPKGASLPAFHHRDDILLQPRLQGRAASWDACLDDLGAALTRIIERHGPDAIAYHQGTGATLDSLGMAYGQRLVAGISTAQFYTAATVDVAPALRAADLVTGSWYLLPQWIPEDAASQLVLLLGINPAVSHGYITILPDPLRRMRRFQARGGRIWTIDPRRTRTAQESSRHLAIRPGGDAALLAWLVRELIEAGGDRTDFAAMTDAADRAALTAALAPCTLDWAVAATGLAAGELQALRDEIRAAGRIGVVAATGIMFSADALLAEWLRWVLLIVTGSLDRQGGMAFNPGNLHPLEQRTDWQPSPPQGMLGPGPKSRPDLPRVFGQYPCVALIDEIEAGHVKALFVAGSSALTAFPDPERTRRALAKLEVLAPIDIVETPITGMATHVLAATGQLERDDVLEESGVMLAPAVVPPLGERRPMWWILGQIGRQLGIDLTGEATPDSAGSLALIRALAAHSRAGAEALFAAGPSGIAAPRRFGWVRERALPDGKWRLVPPGMLDRLAALAAPPPAAAPLVLTNARQVSRVNATAYVPAHKTRDLPAVHLHPDDAAVLRLPAGARVRLTGGGGDLDGTLRLDGSLRRGTVGLSHGWHEVNVCRLTSGGALDPLTGQPQMNGIAVALAPAS